LAAFWAGVASDSVFALLALESLELPEEPFDVSRDGELDVELGEDETGEPSE
jgi:hypothetical protein